MFGFFKNNKETNLDVKGLRDVILQSLKEELQQLDGGEGNHISAIALFVNPAAEEVFKYEAALYTANPDLFREEVQRIADNFAIDLPSFWKMEISFVTDLPAGALKLGGVKAGLAIKNTSVIAGAIELSAARIKVLNGKAEEEEYDLEPGTKRINIGREKNVQAADGSIRVNTIAFSADAHESNRYISRQHAHLEWDKKLSAFMLYADEGGVPPANKTKIRSAQDETLHKLNSTQVGYLLKKGDQVILGESAVIEFQ